MDLFEELKNQKEIQAMVNYDQNNPHHCYNLYDHTMATVEEVGDSPRLKIAALLHDVGKPACAKKKGNQLVFYGHATKSAEIAEKILRGKMSEDDVDFITKIIRHHDDFINFKSSSEYNPNNPWFRLITDENLMDWQEENDFSDEEVLGLLQLCRADAMAQAEHVYGKNGFELLDCSRESKVSKIDYIQYIFESSWI